MLPLYSPYKAPKIVYHSIPFIFLRCLEHQKGFKCLTPNDKIYITLYASFDKLQFPFLKSIASPHTVHSSSCPRSNIPLVVPSSPSTVPSSPMSSSPTCNPSHTQQHISHSITQNHHPMITRSKHGIFKLKVSLSNYVTSSPLTEPRSISEALSIKEWHAAMDLVFQLFVLITFGSWFYLFPTVNL